MSLLNKLPGTKNKSVWPWKTDTNTNFSKNIDWPKISIVTPSFNQGEFIEETILSIINQNYPNLEYIIIDGGSTDNTVEVIKKYEKHLTYWVSEQDRGQAHAINKGIEKCTGEVFNWINSDDYLEPTSLFELGKHFAENKQTHILCGYTHCYFQETGDTSHTYQMGIRKTVTDTILNVEMNQPGSFYRLEIVKELGGVNESLRYVFDDELWFKYLCKYGLDRIKFCDKLFVQFRLHGNSKSVGNGYSEFWKEITNIYYEIASQAKVRDFILSKIKTNTLLFKYKTALWDFSEFEKERFEAWFANKYQYLFYKDFMYKEAEYCIKLAIKYKTIDNFRKAIQLWLKLFFINRRILNWFRKQKI